MGTLREQPERIDPKKLRGSENQTDFWARVGVTQCGGSRYEHGRRMPIPVAHLVKLIYIDGKIELAVNRKV